MYRGRVSGRQLGTWIKNYIINHADEYCTVGKKVKVIRELERLSDGSVVKKTSDRWLTISTIFQSSAIVEAFAKYEDGEPNWREALLILKQFTITFQCTPKEPYGEYVLLVHKFSVWDLQEGFTLKYDLTNCMWEPEIRALADKEREKMADESQHRRGEYDHLLDLMTQTQSQSQRAEDPGPSSREQHQEPGTSSRGQPPPARAGDKERGRPNEEELIPEDIAKMQEAYSQESKDTITDSLLQQLKKPFTAEEFHIPESQLKILECLSEWQSDSNPSMSARSSRSESLNMELDIARASISTSGSKSAADSNPQACNRKTTIERETAAKCLAMDTTDRPGTSACQYLGPVVVPIARAVGSSSAPKSRLGTGSASDPAGQPGTSQQSQEEPHSQASSSQADGSAWQDNIDSVQFSDESINSELHIDEKPVDSPDTPHRDRHNIENMDSGEMELSEQTPEKTADHSELGESRTNDKLSRGCALQNEKAHHSKYDDEKDRHVIKLSKQTTGTKHRFKVRNVIKLPEETSTKLNFLVIDPKTSKTLSRDCAPQNKTTIHSKEVASHAQTPGADHDREEGKHAEVAEVGNSSEKDPLQIEVKDSSPMEQQDSSPMEQQNSSLIAQDFSPLEKKDSSLMEVDESSPSVVVISSTESSQEKVVDRLKKTTSSSVDHSDDSLDFGSPLYHSTQADHTGSRTSPLRRSARFRGKNTNTTCIETPADQHRDRLSCSVNHDKDKSPDIGTDKCNKGIRPELKQNADAEKDKCIDGNSQDIHQNEQKKCKKDFNQKASLIADCSGEELSETELSPIVVSSGSASSDKVLADIVSSSGSASQEKQHSPILTVNSPLSFDFSGSFSERQNRIYKHKQQLTLKKHLTDVVRATRKKDSKAASSETGELAETARKTTSRNDDGSEKEKSLIETPADVTSQTLSTDNDSQDETPNLEESSSSGGIVSPSPPTELSYVIRNALRRAGRIAGKDGHEMEPPQKPVDNDADRSDKIKGRSKQTTAPLNVTYSLSEDRRIMVDYRSGKGNPGKTCKPPDIDKAEGTDDSVVDIRVNDRTNTSVEAEQKDSDSTVDLRPQFYALIEEIYGRKMAEGVSVESSADMDVDIDHSTPERNPAEAMCTHTQTRINNKDVDIDTVESHTDREVARNDSVLAMTGIDQSHTDEELGRNGSVKDATEIDKSHTDEELGRNGSVQDMTEIDKSHTDKEEARNDFVQETAGIDKSIPAVPCTESSTHSMIDVADIREIYVGLMDKHKPADTLTGLCLSERQAQAEKDASEKNRTNDKSQKSNTTVVFDYLKAKQLVEQRSHWKLSRSTESESEASGNKETSNDDLYGSTQPFEVNTVDPLDESHHLSPPNKQCASFDHETQPAGCSPENTDIGTQPFGVCQMGTQPFSPDFTNEQIESDSSLSSEEFAFLKVPPQNSSMNSAPENDRASISNSTDCEVRIFGVSFKRCKVDSENKNKTKNQVKVMNNEEKVPVRHRQKRNRHSLRLRKKAKGKRHSLRLRKKAKGQEQSGNGKEMVGGKSRDSNSGRKVDVDYVATDNDKTEVPVSKRERPEKHIYREQAQRGNGKEMANEKCREKNTGRKVDVDCVATDNDEIEVSVRGKHVKRNQMQMGKGTKLALERCMKRNNGRTADTDYVATDTDDYEARYKNTQTKIVSARTWLKEHILKEQNQKGNYTKNAGATSRERNTGRKADIDSVATDKDDLEARCKKTQADIANTRAEIEKTRAEVGTQAAVKETPAEIGETQAEVGTQAAVKETPAEIEETQTDSKENNIGNEGTHISSKETDSNSEDIHVDSEETHIEVEKSDIDSEENDIDEGQSHTNIEDSGTDRELARNESVQDTAGPDTSHADEELGRNDPVLHVDTPGSDRSNDQTNTSVQTGRKDSDSTVDLRPQFYSLIREKDSSMPVVSCAESPTPSLINETDIRETDEANMYKEAEPMDHEERDVQSGDISSVKSQNIASRYVKHSEMQGSGSQQANLYPSSTNETDVRVSDGTDVIVKTEPIDTDDPGGIEKYPGLSLFSSPRETREKETVAENETTSESMTYTNRVICKDSVCQTPRLLKLRSKYRKAGSIISRNAKMSAKTTESSKQKEDNFYSLLRKHFPYKQVFKERTLQGQLDVRKEKARNSAPTQKVLNENNLIHVRTTLATKPSPDKKVCEVRKTQGHVNVTKSTQKINQEKGEPRISAQAQHMPDANNLVDVSTTRLKKCFVDLTKNNVLFKSSRQGQTENVSNPLLERTKHACVIQSKLHEKSSSSSNTSSENESITIDGHSYGKKDQWMNYIQSPYRDKISEPKQYPAKRRSSHTSVGPVLLRKIILRERTADSDCEARAYIKPGHYSTKPHADSQALAESTNLQSELIKTPMHVATTVAEVQNIRGSEGSSKSKQAAGMSGHTGLWLSKDSGKAGAAKTSTLQWENRAAGHSPSTGLVGTAVSKKKRDEDRPIPANTSVAKRRRDSDILPNTEGTKNPTANTSIAKRRRDTDFPPNTVGAVSKQTRDGDRTIAANTSVPKRRHIDTDILTNTIGAKDHTANTSVVKRRGDTDIRHNTIGAKDHTTNTSEAKRRRDTNILPNTVLAKDHTANTSEAKRRRDTDILPNTIGAKTQTTDTSEAKRRRDTDFPHNTIGAKDHTTNTTAVQASPPNPEGDKRRLTLFLASLDVGPPQTEIGRRLQSFKLQPLGSGIIDHVNRNRVREKRRKQKHDNLKQAFEKSLQEH